MRRHTIWYCNKTKILIFNGTTKDYKHTFMIGNIILENVKEYKYLGITFTKFNNFRITKQIVFVFIFYEYAKLCIVNMCF